MGTSSNKSQNCLNEAYDDQLKMIVEFDKQTIKIKLFEDGKFLEIQPNCKFNTSSYGIDFEHPSDINFENTSMYFGNGNTALVTYCNDNECSNKYFDKLINKGNLLFNKLNTKKYKFLVGYGKLIDFQKCQNTTNNWIFIMIYKGIFKFFENNTLIDFNIENLKALSIKLDKNNINGIYFFNKESEITDIIIDQTTNEYNVYIEDFYTKQPDEFGLADSCAMYNLFMLHNTNENEKKKLKLLFEKRYNNLSQEQKKNFETVFLSKST